MTIKSNVLDNGNAIYGGMGVFDCDNLSVLAIPTSKMVYFMVTIILTYRDHNGYSAK